MTICLNVGFMSVSRAEIGVRHRLDVEPDETITHQAKEYRARLGCETFWQGDKNRLHDFRLRHPPGLWIKRLSPAILAQLGEFGHRLGPGLRPFEHAFAVFLPALLHADSESDLPADLWV